MEYVFLPPWKYHWDNVPDDTLSYNRTELEKLKYNKYIKINEWVVDIKGFYPYINELANDVLKFKVDHMTQATTIFDGFNSSLHTMVSIHIRLTDYPKFIKRRWKMEYSADEYFGTAMEYFHKKYKDVLFYVLSDDVLGAKQKLANANINNTFNIVYPGTGDRLSPGVDLALLSLANHSILSYGTFSMWGALLANKGEVLMPSDHGLDKIGKAIKMANITNWKFI